MLQNKYPWLHVTWYLWECICKKNARGVELLGQRPCAILISKDTVRLPSIRVVLVASPPAVFEPVTLPHSPCQHSRVFAWTQHFSTCLNAEACYGASWGSPGLRAPPPIPSNTVRVFSGKNQPMMRAMVLSQQSLQKLALPRFLHIHSFSTFFLNIMVLMMSFYIVDGCFFSGPVNTSKRLVKSDNTVDSACCHCSIPVPGTWDFQLHF